MVEMTWRRSESSWAGSVGSFAPCACRLKISSSTCEARTGRFATTASTRSTTTVVSPCSAARCAGATAAPTPWVVSAGTAESLAAAPAGVGSTAAESAPAESATEVESCAVRRPAPAQSSSDATQAAIRVEWCCFIVPSSFLWLALLRLRGPAVARLGLRCGCGQGRGIGRHRCAGDRTGDRRSARRPTQAGAGLGGVGRRLYRLGELEGAGHAGVIDLVRQLLPEERGERARQRPEPGLPLDQAIEVPVHLEPGGPDAVSGGHRGVAQGAAVQSHLLFQRIELGEIALTQIAPLRGRDRDPRGVRVAEQQHVLGQDAGETPKGAVVGGLELSRIRGRQGPDPPHELLRRERSALEGGDRR